MTLLDSDIARNHLESRQRLLDAGVDLLQEQPAGDVTSHVKAPLVSARAGLTPGAFYYHWPKQRLFVRELLEYLLNPETSKPSADVYLDRLRQPVSSIAEFEDRYRAIAIENLRLVTSTSRFAVQMAIWTRQTDDAFLRDLLRKLYAGHERRLTTAYTEGFRGAGLEPRPPFTIPGITAILTAFFEGAAVRHSIDPEAMPAETYGDAVIALLRQLLQPIRNEPDFSGS